MRHFGVGRAKNIDVNRYVGKGSVRRNAGRYVPDDESRKIDATRQISIFLQFSSHLSKNCTSMIDIGGFAKINRCHDGSRQLQAIGS